MIRYVYFASVSSQTFKNARTFNSLPTQLTDRQTNQTNFVPQGSQLWHYIVIILLLIIIIISNKLD